MPSPPGQVSRIPACAVSRTCRTKPWSSLVLMLLPWPPFKNVGLLPSPLSSVEFSLTLFLLTLWISAPGPPFYLHPVGNCATPVVLSTRESVPDCSNPRAAPLTFQDIDISESEITVRIAASKTDPFRRGSTLHLSATGACLCPVRAVARYVQSRPLSSSSAAFLISQSGQALSRRQFTEALRQCLAVSGVPDADRYSAHSFRIGAATTAAMHGVAEWLIQACGRWSSDCFPLYTRALPAQLRQMSCALAAE